MSREDRFVFVPLRLRREHRDWSNAEHAAWLDLYLASFEVDGAFDSLDVARAYLGPRAAGLDALVARGAFAELDGVWSLSDYLELYDGRRPRHYRTLAQRLTEADELQAEGKPLEPIHRWARWKARQKAKRAESETESEQEKEGDKDKERDRANVRPTLANDSPSCSICGSALKELTNRNTGEVFEGCPNYRDHAPTKPPAWQPSPEDLAIIEGQTPLLRRGAGND